MKRWTDRWLGQKLWFSNLVRSFFSRSTSFNFATPRPIEQGIRRYAVKRFPICFAHDEAQRDVVIYAVMHVRRDPDYWKSRLPD